MIFGRFFVSIVPLSQVRDTVSIRRIDYQKSAWLETIKSISRETRNRLDKWRRFARWTERVFVSRLFHARPIQTDWISL